MLLLGASVGAPLYEAFYAQYLQRSSGMPSFPDPNAPVFALAFYRQAFPVIVQAISVVFPAFWGIRKGAGLANFRPLFRAGLWTAAIASLTVILVQNQGLWILLRVPVRLRFPQSWSWQLEHMVVFWPAAYFVAIAIRRLNGVKTVSDTMV